MHHKLISKITFNDLMLCVLGAFIYAVGINVFITPLNLYAGGFVGISQLLAIPFPNIPNVNVNGIIYFIINIPLFIIAIKKLGKKLVAKSLFIVVMDSLLLSFIPIPKAPLINDMLTGCIIAGAIEGIGCVLTFLGFGSSGGTDILGLLLAKKFKSLSVGKVSFAINLCIYLICIALFSFEIAVYSFIVCVVESYIVDKFHMQNNNVSINIITNSKQEEIKEYIVNELDRDATIINGIGGYSQNEKHVIISVMSEYELANLKKKIQEIDKDAFIFIHPNISIMGNFEKRLSR